MELSSGAPGESLRDLFALVRRDPAHVGLRASARRLGALPAHAPRRYESDRREALLGFLGPSLISLVVWAAVMWGEEPPT